MIGQYFPGTSDRTPWRIAFLSQVPFLFAGPLAVIVGYQPSWGAGQFPSLASIFLIITAVSICLGFILGILHKFPRWAYLYMGYGLILLIVLTGNLVNRIAWDFPYAGLLPLAVAALAILFTALLPAFRPFYAHIRQDWTLLSYALYAFTLLILSVQDHDEAPRLTLLVLLPSLIGLLGALAHLRLASAVQRVFTLLLSMLLAALIYSLPLFNSMGGSVDGFLLALNVLLILWLALAALIIAPMLIGLFSHPNKSTTA